MLKEYREYEATIKRVGDLCHLRIQSWAIHSKLPAQAEHSRPLCRSRSKVFNSKMSNCLSRIVQNYYARRRIIQFDDEPLEGKNADGDY